MMNEEELYSDLGALVAASMAGEPVGLNARGYQIEIEVRHGTVMYFVNDVETTASQVLALMEHAYCGGH